MVLHYDFHDTVKHICSLWLKIKIFLPEVQVENVRYVSLCFHF